VGGGERGDRDNKTITGWHVKLCFKISVHNKDRALLELIQRSLGIGKIYKHGSNSIELRVSSVKDLLVLIDQAYGFFLFYKKKLINIH
jgi:hypothetical protein